MWKVEKCNEQIIPVQLESRRPRSSQPFDQVQLKDICLLETSTRVYIWHSFQDTNINRAYFQNMIQSAQTIARKLSQGQNNLRLRRGRNRYLIQSSIKRSHSRLKYFFQFSTLLMIKLNRSEIFAEDLVQTVRSGSEPSSFQQLFPVWQREVFVV